MKKAILLALSVTGCTVGGGSDAPLGYDQFAAKYIGSRPDGQHFYDWDIPLTDAQVSKLYGAYVRAKMTGESLSESQVQITLFGERDVWSAGDRQNLSYCVSDAFGGYKSTVVSAMADATQAWNTAAGGNVRYVYQPQYDAACSNATPTTFDVVPYNDPNDGTYAFAFFPSTPRDQREVHVNLANAFSGGFPFTGILRHELGHTLGLRHETNRVEAIIDYGIQCFEDVFVEPLTDYDSYSVMTTPACMGDALLNKQLVISSDDVTGVRELYQ